jgi:tRNA-dihydrouridine synthase 1
MLLLQQFIFSAMSSTDPVPDVLSPHALATSRSATATAAADEAATLAPAAAAASAANAARPDVDWSSMRFVAAPMVNQSDAAWRMMLRRHGTQVVYTAMLDSARLVRDESYRRSALLSFPQERAHGGALVVQLAANDAATFVAAGLLVQDHCDAVDFNLGCPQRAARTGLYGAYLLDEEHHERVFAMLREAVATLSVPVFAKIRLLPSLERTLAFCRGLRATGIRVLAVHGRTRGCVEERRKGPADLEQIRAIVDAMRVQAPEHDASSSSSDNAPPPPLLVWTNGNVRCEADVPANLSLTGANAAMVGEALLNDPTLFERCTISSHISSSGALRNGCRSPPPSSLSSGLIPATAIPAAAVVELSLAEFARRSAVLDEYLQLLHSFPSSSFDAHGQLAPSSSASPSSTTSAATAATTIPAGPPGAADAASFVPEDWPYNRIVPFAHFHAHVYRLFNADSRARFLHRTQLTDEFLDTAAAAEEHGLAALRAVLSEVEARLRAGRPFDEELQLQIDSQRSARQTARAALEKQRVQQATGVRVLNSKQRKRARWQQRKQERMQQQNQQQHQPQSLQGEQPQQEPQHNLDSDSEPEPGSKRVKGAIAAAVTLCESIQPSDAALT